ncbi:unnamed protein product [Toxocara canis]|uniref:LisH domain-containing protein n=1 Tax=Toxocara canis TaxID=6265 RepID=A0A183TXT8_TOXCA|nr:unnamed protein product [Toxocara canis]
MSSMRKGLMDHQKGAWLDEEGSHDEPREETTFNSEPTAVRIIETLNEDHSFRLDEAALEKILLSPEVVDEKVWSILQTNGCIEYGRAACKQLLFGEANLPERTQNWFFDLDAVAKCDHS